MGCSVKKYALFCAAAAGLLLLSGCASATTITEREGNYVYGENEEINIVDIDTRDTIGTLKMTGAIVLRDEPISLWERDGIDENGEAVYKETVYEQVVQIFYTYENKGGDSVSAANFDVYDAQGRYGTMDPGIDVKPASRKGQQSFVVALDNRSGALDLHFKYNILQSTTTAKIRLALPGAAANGSQTSAAGRTTSAAKPTTTRPSVTGGTGNAADARPEQTTRPAATTTAAGESLPSEQAAPAYLYLLIAVLSAAVIILIVALIVVVAYLAPRQHR